MTTSPSLRLRMLAVAAGVGLAFCCATNGPVAAQPGEAGGDSGTVVEDSGIVVEDSGTVVGVPTILGPEEADEPVVVPEPFIGPETPEGDPPDDGDAGSGDAGGDGAENDSGADVGEVSPEVPEPPPPAETEPSEPVEPVPSEEPLPADPEPQPTERGNRSSRFPGAGVRPESFPWGPESSGPVASRTARSSVSDVRRSTTRASGSVSSGEPGRSLPTTAPRLRGSAPSMAQHRGPAPAATPEPHHEKTGAMGVLAFLGINFFGGETNGAIGPAPWLLLWWVRRFGGTPPVVGIEPGVNPYANGAVSSALAVDAGLDAAATGPAPTAVPDTLPDEPSVAEPTPPGVLRGTVTIAAVDGTIVTPAVRGVTTVGASTYLTRNGGALTFEPSTGAFTYAPTLRARIAAVADGAPENARFDTFTLVVDDSEPSSISVALPIAGPYVAGSVDVPGMRRIQGVLATPDG